MNSILFWGVFAIGLAYLAYMVVGHGVPWVWAKIKSIAGTVAGWFGRAKAEVASLESRVKVLELFVHDHLVAHAQPAPAAYAPGEPVHPAAPPPPPPNPPMISPEGAAAIQAAS